jgi:hypothetical protein
MISEMLKVRDGRILRILARSSRLSVTRNVARGEAGLSKAASASKSWRTGLSSGRSHHSRDSALESQRQKAREDDAAQRAGPNHPAWRYVTEWRGTQANRDTSSLGRYVASPIPFVELLRRPVS